MSNKKYDPHTDDSHYWRYQQLVEDWSATMSEKLNLFGPSAENFKLITAYLAKKIYERGYDDAEELFKKILDGKEKVVN